MKKKPFTLSAVGIFSLPILSMASFIAWLAFGGWAFQFEIVEKTLINPILALVCVILLILVPIVTILSTACIVGTQTVALIRKELPWLNALFIAVSVILCIAYFCLYYKVWQGMMSV